MIDRIGKFIDIEKGYLIVTEQRKYYVYEVMEYEKSLLEMRTKRNIESDFNNNINKCRFKRKRDISKYLGDILTGGK